MWLNSALPKRQVWFLFRRLKGINLSTFIRYPNGFTITEGSRREWTNGSSKMISPEILDRWME